MTVALVGSNDYTVRVGDRYMDKLCWDEALGVVAATLMSGPDNEFRPLATREEHARRWGKQSFDVDGERRLTAEELASAAVQRAKDLGIDDAVRRVARSDASDSLCNYSGQWEGIQCRATSGAGTNSARAVDASTGTVLYEAVEYGRHVETFREGPWCDRVIARAAWLLDADAKRDEAIRRESERREAEKFMPVDV
ncbi:MAG TPA: hypothetical protein VK324_13765 [Tepidisphaeraceae bacterium]|nr:hypothetical protein [Tepidisphaeraceae bacterium]